MSTATPADATLKLLAELKDATKYKVVPRVPIFTEHKRFSVPTAEGGNARVSVLPDEPDPVGGTYLYTVDRKKILETAARINRNLQNNRLPMRLMKKHSQDPGSEHVGWGVGAEVGDWGTGKWATIYTDTHAQIDKIPLLKGCFTRSSEYYPRSGDITAIAMLDKEDPSLPLGAVAAYSKDLGGVEFYSMGLEPDFFSMGDEDKHDKAAKEMSETEHGMAKKIIKGSGEEGDEGEYEKPHHIDTSNWKIKSDQHAAEAVAEIAARSESLKGKHGYGQDDHDLLMQTLAKGLPAFHKAYHLDAWKEIHHHYDRNEPSHFEIGAYKPKKKKSEDYAMPGATDPAVIQQDATPPPGADAIDPTGTPGPGADISPQEEEQLVTRVWPAMQRLFPQIAFLCQQYEAMVAPPEEPGTVNPPGMNQPEGAIPQGGPGASGPGNPPAGSGGDSQPPAQYQREIAELQAKLNATTENYKRAATERVMYGLKTDGYVIKDEGKLRLKLLTAGSDEDRKALEVEVRENYQKKPKDSSGAPTSQAMLPVDDGPETYSNCEPTTPEIESVMRERRWTSTNHAEFKQAIAIAKDLKRKALNGRA